VRWRPVPRSPRWCAPGRAGSGYATSARALAAPATAGSCSCARSAAIATADRTGGSTRWAGDPAGPFGRGRLRSGQRVTWFYGRKQGASFQRTLELKAAVSGRTVSVTVRGYDDNGHGVAVSGAAVSSGAGSAQTGTNGRATLELPPGRHLFHASKPGFVRSFGERVVVR